MNRSTFLKRLGIGVVAAPVVAEALGEERWVRCTLDPDVVDIRATIGEDGAKGYWRPRGAPEWIRDDSVVRVVYGGGHGIQVGVSNKTDRAWDVGAFYMDMA